MDQFTWHYPELATPDELEPFLQAIGIPVPLDAIRQWSASRLDAVQAWLEAAWLYRTAVVTAPLPAAPPELHPYLRGEWCTGRPFRHEWRPQRTAERLHEAG